MENKMISVPLGAMQFLNKSEKVVDSLEMLVYSGQVIKNHWYWNNLAIDLTGMSFPKDKYPILENHNVDRKIAFVEKSEIEINGNLKISGGTFMDTAAAKEFRKLSKEDFPYESSMYAKPTVIERVNEEETAKVNGMSVKGPVTIWRKSIFKEASLCVFGYDPETSAKAAPKDTLSFSVDMEGDLDDIIAENLYRLARNGQVEEPEQLSAEDEKTAQDLFKSTGGDSDNT